MQLAKKAGKTNAIGEIGEDIAVRYLESKGFSIIDRNYTQKCGEIDIIAQKEGILHLVEVKTVSYETKAELERSIRAGYWRPEEHYTKQKHERFSRTAELYVQETGWAGEYQLDLLAISVVSREKYSEVEYFEQVLLG